MFDNDRTEQFFDEVFSAPGARRAHYGAMLEAIGGLTPAEFGQRQRAADNAFLRQGVTFTVYGDDQGTERIFPFDLIPRIPRRAKGVTRKGHTRKG